jgi:Uma2 family endonuclease
MAPEGGSSGRANSKLNQLFENWAERDATGQVFSSSAGFILPDESMRSPNGAWVRNERLEKVTDEQWQKFLPICPDFVLELRSPSDSIRVLWVNG